MVVTPGPTRRVAARSPSGAGRASTGAGRSSSASDAPPAAHRSKGSTSAAADKPAVTRAAKAAKLAAGLAQVAAGALGSGASAAAAKSTKPPSTRPQGGPNSRWAQRRAQGVVRPPPVGGPRLMAFNKPMGVICQFSASEGHRTLQDFIKVKEVYPAGRLDTDSEGLLLLTNDGGLQHRISDPAHKLSKVYWVQVEGIPDEAALAALRAGVLLPDGLTLPADARLMEPPADLWERQPPIRARKEIPTCWIELTLKEGRNRQVRRMTAAIGFPTLRLIRWSVGPYTLEGIAPGQWANCEIFP